MLVRMQQNGDKVTDKVIDEVTDESTAGVSRYRGG
jgi:hypothetical protein